MYKINIAVLSVVLVWMGGCIETPTVEPCGDYALQSWDDEAQWQELCRQPDKVPLCYPPVTSDVAEDNLQRAYDIVFIGDGYTEGDMLRYQTRVAELIEGLRNDEHGIVARAPELFNFHRVDLVSATDRILDADTTNTPLGMCLDRDWLTDNWMLRLKSRGVARLVARNAPDADVIVVIADTGEGRANAGRLDEDTRLVLLNHLDAHHVLTHEHVVLFFEIGK